jgi:hypothetical protein
MNRQDEKREVTIDEVTVVVTIHWCPAEPDVGIFSAYYEVADVRYPDGSDAYDVFSDEQIRDAVDD